MDVFFSHFQAQRVISFFISACLSGTDSQANSFSKYMNKLAFFFFGWVSRGLGHELQLYAVQSKNTSELVIRSQITLVWTCMTI